ncbi:hypothetical protein ACQZ4Q_24575 [Agrobacterium vitis]|uniref:hypothetical protein n=1 Tax=Agrobacterium vitis TaxID=373 RepID=UPI0015D95E41|nr:hypothetical protein [Agrobacterium vitis]BCH62597.1 hypothetical protein RvVAR0630_pl07390 [Agrobacterium vitis]
MAALWDKDAKTFLITDAGSVKDRALSLGIYKRTPDFNKVTQTYKEQRRLPFGLSTKEDIYAFAGRSENGDLYMRGTKHESNWVRKKDTEYYPGKGKKSEDRRYFGGLFSSGKDYDRDGEIIGTREGDLFGSTRWSKSKDGRHESLEHDDFGGWHRSRREAIGLPDGRRETWRTMERHVGSYSMTIAPSQDGTQETKTRSLGRLAGRAIFERAVTYDFETGQKTTRYGGLLRRILPRPKPSPISARDMDAYHIRRDAAQAAGNAWSDHALGLKGNEGMELSSSDRAARFKEGLQNQGRATNRVSDWVEERQAEHEASSRQPIPFRTGAVARHHDTLRDVSVGESSSDTLVASNRSERSATLSSSSIASDKAVASNGSDVEKAPSVSSLRVTRPASVGLRDLPSLPPDTPLRHIKAQERMAREANRSSNENDADDESDVGTTTANTRKKPRKQAFVEKSVASDSSQDGAPPTRKPARVVKTRERAGADRTGTVTDRNLTDKDLAGAVNPRPVPKDFKIGRLSTTAGKAPAGLGDDSSDDQSAASSRAKGRTGLPTTQQTPRFDRLSDNDLAGVVNTRRVSKDFKIGRISSAVGEVPPGLGDDSDSDSGPIPGKRNLDSRSDHSRARGAASFAD